MSQASSTESNYDKEEFDRVRDAVAELVADSEFVYVKPSNLGSDLGMTGRATGKHLRTLRESDNEFEISLWGDSRSDPKWLIKRTD